MKRREVGGKRGLSLHAGLEDQSTEYLTISKAAATCVRRGVLYTDQVGVYGPPHIPPTRPVGWAAAH
jgi:hypothetical protein